MRWVGLRPKGQRGRLKICSQASGQQNRRPLAMYKVMSSERSGWDVCTDLF